MASLIKAALMLVYMSVVSIYVMMQLLCLPCEAAYDIIMQLTGVDKGSYELQCNFTGVVVYCTVFVCVCVGIVWCCW